MGVKRTGTTLIVIAVVTFLAVLTFYVRIGATADSVVVLKTTGMTCGSCSNKIAKSLGTMKGVAVTEVDVEGGRVVVSYDTKIVKPEALAEKITETGFSSKVQTVLTPEQFKAVTGRDIGKSALPAGACGGCGSNGGCGSKKQS